MVVTEIKKKLRLIYGATFLLIFAIEICIALFMCDDFIRPYVGDMLVTVLMCCYVRFFIPEKFGITPLLVFIFSLLVEIGQYFDFVKILGLDNNSFISVLHGRTFSFADIICYGIGCVVFAVLDHIIKRKSRGAL